jgi:hypothetical protein
MYIVYAGYNHDIHSLAINAINNGANTLLSWCRPNYVDDTVIGVELSMTTA